MSRVLVRQSSDNLRRSYLRDAVGTPARGMFDDSAPASSMLYRGQYDPSLEINYVDDPRLAVGETFTRATIGTTVDFEGRVLTAKSGEARFYGMRRVENRLRFTEDFTNALWTKTGASVAARAPASGAPLKDRMSDKLVEDTSAGNHQINQSVAYVLGATYCVYVDVAPGERTWCELLFPSSAFGSARGSYFDLVNGVVGSAVTGITARGIFPVGDGFLRCWILHTASASASGTPTLRIATADLTDNYTGDGRSGVYLRRAQDQDVSGQSWQGPSEYVSVDMLPAPYHGANVDGVRYHTTTYQGAKIPRYTATAPSVGRCGLLRERASTNYILNSADFSAASWTKRNGHTVTADQGVAPDGTNTADLVTVAAVLAGSSQGILADSVAAGNVAYDFSVYLKSLAGITSVTMVIKDRSADTIRATKLCAVTSAWQRFDLTGTPAGASTGFRLEFQAEQNGTMLVWGAQGEPLDHVTSYIPTTAVAVTRNKDSITLATGAWFNAAEGAIAVEAQPAYVGGAISESVDISDGTSSNSMRLSRSTASAVWGVVNGGGVQASITNGTWITTAPKRAAAAYKTNDFQEAFDGVLGTQDTAGTVPTVTTLTIGDRGAGGFEWDGFIGRVHYYPQRLPDSQLAAAPRGST